MSRKRRKLEVFAKFARELGALSTCGRKAAGCVVFPADFSRVISIGYNGPPAGFPSEFCNHTEKPCGCVHAEQNALLKPRLPENNLIMFVTRAPCEGCANLIINSRSFSLVIYEHMSSSGKAGGLSLLTQAGIKVEPLDVAFTKATSLSSWERLCGVYSRTKQLIGRSHRSGLPSWLLF